MKFSLSVRLREERIVLLWEHLPPTIAAWLQSHKWPRHLKWLCHGCPLHFVLKYFQYAFYSTWSRDRLSVEFTRSCMEIYSSVTFLIQILLIFRGRCNRYFWDIRLKMYRLPNFNILFQVVLTKFFKFKLFSCLPKVDHVINWCKRPITCPFAQGNMKVNFKMLVEKLLANAMVRWLLHVKQNPQLLSVLIFFKFVLPYLTLYLLCFSLFLLML